MSEEYGILGFEEESSGSNWVGILVAGAVGALLVYWGEDWAKKQIVDHMIPLLKKAVAEKIDDLLKDWYWLPPLVGFFTGIGLFTFGYSLNPIFLLLGLVFLWLAGSRGKKPIPSS